MPGSIVATQVFGMAAGSFAATATAFAINMVAASIISKAVAPQGPSINDDTRNPGSNAQVPPAGDNKLPVIYGSAYVGGIVTDLSITSNNQKLFYVLALSEVTNTETGGTPDTFTFGDIYWGGKKCIFGTLYGVLGTVQSVGSFSVVFAPSIVPPNPGDIITFSNTGTPTQYTVLSWNPATSVVTFTSALSGVTVGMTAYTNADNRVNVIGLLDESTGITDTTVAGSLRMYLYNNGSYSGQNTAVSAIQVMQSVGLVYQWDNTKLMSNCAFAIVELEYNPNANITSLQQTRFQLTSTRYKPGDCLLDYLTSERYGAALSTAQIDTTSLTALNVYSNETVTYTPYTGGTATQVRFRYDGVLDTNNTIMNNLQVMASCCDCLIKYNQITGKWGVVVQSPTYAVAMNVNDSNMVSAIQITPIDLASSFNIAEVKFADGSSKDTFNSAIFDLAIINPSLLYPNEPINKQTINLQLINNSVRAQYLANRFLEAAREDLQVKVDINFSGIQLDAGDIVTITNTNYGWVAKLFRVSQIVETFSDDGQITASLSLMEYNPTIYDDLNITQFTPAPNTGIGSPLGFGTLYTPTITNVQAFAPVPSFDVAITAASAGIVQYAEVYYSLYASPTDAQRMFAGITAVNPGGNPYTPSASMGVVTLSNIPQGDWYFAVRYVNSLGTSNFSTSSAVYKWRPQTYQYTERYLALAYADNATGTSGFNYIPRNKSYFGVYNNASANGGTDPTLYTWYPVPVAPATPTGTFGTTAYFVYSNRNNRKLSWNVANAGFVNLGGAFVPTETSVYDPSQWSGVQDPTGGVQSFIDLDSRTGQLIRSGSTSNNFNDGFLAVSNNTDGSMVVNLKSFLNFGDGVYTRSFAAATLTIDVYGRVVGFAEQDGFNYTETVFNATSGQTSFSLTHTVGWILVFRDGVLLDPTEYSETSTTVVMANACAVNEKIVIIYMYGISTAQYYEPLNITIASSTSNSITYNSAPWNSIVAGEQLCFANTGTPTLYTVSTINTTTKVITFTTTIAGATAGLSVYRNRAAGSNYAPFTRYTQSVSSITSFTPTAYALNNGYESIYVNGVQINEIDYDLSVNTIGGFPAALTGNLTIIQYTQNNLAVPASNIKNTVAYSINGALTYVFASNPLAMEIYANGAFLIKGSGYDYTASANNYILTTAFDNNVTLLNQQTFGRTGAA
jgi:hypothetical protein